MPEDDQKSINTKTDPEGTSTKQSATVDVTKDQEKAPEGHKTILIGKAFVIGGVAVRIDDLPKKSRAGEEIVIHGLNLKVYDEVALFVAGSWYKPINLHLARREGQAIEFTLPNFNKILTEGNDIWVRLSSSLFTQASGTLSRYIAYTLKEDEDAEEQKKKKEQAEKEKKEKFELQGADSKLGLSALMGASVGVVLGGMAEPFVPAFLKKDSALQDAKAAMQAGNKKVLKEAAKKSKDLKDLKGLKNLLKDAGDSESRQILLDNISELESKGLAPKQLSKEEVQSVKPKVENDDLTYLDDDSEQVVDAQEHESSSREALYAEQQANAEFAEQFKSNDDVEVSGGLGKDDIIKSAQLLKNEIENNPKLIPDPVVREKIITALNTGNLGSLDMQSAMVLSSMIVSGSLPASVVESSRVLSSVISSNLGTSTVSSTVESVKSSTSVQGGGSSSVSATVTSGGSSQSGVVSSNTSKVESQVQTTLQSEGRSSTQATGGGGSSLKQEVDVTVNGSNPLQTNANLEQTVSDQTEADAKIDSGKSNDAKSSVNLEGKSKLNVQEELKLQQERANSVAGTGSKVSQSLQSNSGPSSGTGFGGNVNQGVVSDTENPATTILAQTPVKPENEFGQKPEQYSDQNNNLQTPADSSKKPTLENDTPENSQNKIPETNTPTQSPEILEEEKLGLPKQQPNKFGPEKTNSTSPAYSPPAGKLKKTLDPKIRQAMEIGKGLSSLAGRNDLGAAVENYGNKASEITGKIDSAIESDSVIGLAQDGLVGSKADMDWVAKLEYTEKILKVAEEIATLTGREDIAEIAQELRGVIDPNELNGIKDAGALRKTASNLAGNYAAKKAENLGGLAGNKAAALGGAVSGALQGEGVGGIIKTGASWYVLYIAFGALFTLVGSIPALLYLNIHYLLSKMGVSWFATMNIKQKATLLLADIIVGGGLILIFIVLLFTGCNYPSSGKLSVFGLIGMSDLCQSVDSITGSETQGAGIASQGGPVTTTNWTSQINQVAGKNALNPCILRAVVQKRAGTNSDLGIIAKNMQVAISKNGNNLSAAFADQAGLGVSKTEAEELTILYNMCVNRDKGE